MENKIIDFAIENRILQVCKTSILNCSYPRHVGEFEWSVENYTHNTIKPTITYGSHQFSKSPVVSNLNLNKDLF